MSRIVVHAGMSKAGSSSIQRWLVQADLPAGSVLVFRADAPGQVRVEDFDRRGANSGEVIHGLRSSPHADDVAQAMAAALERTAQVHAAVVTSAEAFAQVVWMPIRPLLDQLQRLAGNGHEVIVAYYIRAQNTALEAAWRQWGFRSGQSPSAYVRDRVGTSNRYDYAATVAAFREVAPDVHLHIRPLDPAALVGGDVVVDFASLLGHDLATDDGTPARANIGLSLTMTNALYAPDGIESIGLPVHDNRAFAQVHRWLGDLDVVDDADAAAGQAVLTRWCRDRFESSNQRIAEQEQWGLEHLVPDVAADDDLSRLDVVWGRQGASAPAVALRRMVRERLQIEGLLD